MDIVETQNSNSLTLGDRPCLVLAPHLTYPLRNGADILIHNRWSAFSQFIPYVDIIGQDSIKRYLNGKLTESEEYSNTIQSKSHAALRTILRPSQYLREKFITSEFIDKAKQYMANSSYGCIIGSYIYTAPLLAKDPHSESRFHLIETHNDDVKWYRTLRESTINPFAKLVANLSERWTIRTVGIHWKDLIFLYVTKADREGIDQIAPHHRSIHAPIGVNIPDSSLTARSNTDPLHLLFVGSLGVTMNWDALNYFANRFYWVLKQHFGESLHVNVAGASPSAKVRTLCNNNGWNLHADISDSKLHSLYRQASFTFLPFKYATGAKLKMLESLAHGVPFLATTQVRGQLDSSPPLCLFSDKPTEWLEHVLTVHMNGQSKEERMSLVSLARRFSWSSSAEKIFSILNGKFQDYNENLSP